MRIYFLGALALLSVLPAQAQDTVAPPTSTPSIAAQIEQPPTRKRRIPAIGPDFGVYYLLDGKTRDRFGSTVTDLGFGIGHVAPSLKGKLGIDLSILRPSETQNSVEAKATLIEVGPEYKRAYLSPQMRKVLQDAETDPSSSVMPKILPYYGASLNALYAKIESPQDGVDESKFGAGGSIFIGAAFKERAFLEARARLSTDVAGFNFSGVGLQFGLRF